MAGGHIGRALLRLRGLLGAHCADGPADGELLRRYVHARDEVAFEALLRRHGPMVLGVCRRLLVSAEDVDDAFQATFLILVRKARSIGDGERVGNWLYGVAYRVAIRARAQAARLRARQRALTDIPCEEPAGEALREELRLLVDEEVSRLPALYREAVVCCYLQGRTQEEAARVLGWPKGTVATRLNRARSLLRNRLIRRGLPLSAGALVGALRAGGAEAGVPAALVRAALRTTGRAVTGSALPGAIAGLANGVLRQSLVGRIKVVAAGLLALTLVSGGGGLALRALNSHAVAPAKEADTAAGPARYYAWREQSDAHRPGDRAQMAVRGRNAPGRQDRSARPADPRAGDERISEAGLRVTALVVTVDRKLVVSVSEDGTVYLCDPTTGLAWACTKRDSGWTLPTPLGHRDSAAARDDTQVDTIILQTAVGQEGDARSSHATSRVTSITFLSTGQRFPRGEQGCSLDTETSRRVSGSWQVRHAVSAPRSRLETGELRVCLPPDHVCVRTSKVVIRSAPLPLPAPRRSAQPAPAPHGEEPPTEAAREREA
jgi:RNA polymerase sigma factor (sigma-70 family)